jgi:opacity protein-like surface antigen
MRSHIIKLALLLALLGAASTAHAEKVTFMLDLAGGITIPIADDDYKSFTDTSFKLSLRPGAVFYINRHFGAAVEGELAWVPVNSNDTNFEDNNIDARFHRVRLLGGGRFIVPFGIGSVYVRAALGLDHLTGSITVPKSGPIRRSFSSSSTAFTFEPGLGVQFNVVRHLVVGLYCGFPIQTDQNLRFTVINGVSTTTTFQPFDVDILAVIGFRL